MYFDRKTKHTDWQEFLSTSPAPRYTFQNRKREELISDAAEMIKNSDAVLIGAGAGLSTAAGFTYGGTRFTENFGEFIEKYGKMYMTDMYAGGFYPFKTEEEKWGFWSKNVMVNRIIPDAAPLYRQLYDLVKDRDYFVLTTNVDHQFQKAGFDENRFFATQGDYGEIQCENACHAKVYNAVDLFIKMDGARKNCLIPPELVPKCPVCGGNMAMHLRSDETFIEDEPWHDAADRYAEFLRNHKDKKVVLLEIGVGFNTPVIIRFPFEKFAKAIDGWSLVRLNRDEPEVPDNILEKSVGIGGDTASALDRISELLKIS